jgi:ABC-type nitrate/sulfonate/bicarbonate transport system permease component
LRIGGSDLCSILGDDPKVAEDVLTRVARMVVDDFKLPSWFAQVQDIPNNRQRRSQALPTSQLTGWTLTMYRMGRWFASPKPYLMLIGFAIFFGSWFFASEVWHFWRFDNLPGPWEVLQEWVSVDPIYGLSLFTEEYYTHIWVSVRRILIAFAIATALGVPVGLFLGWSQKFRAYVFPLFETLRPIPILAWVPLAIIMFTGLESPVIFLTTLASFYATALNTMLGVQSIDESYPRAAACLGASKWQIFRYIIVPGALPYMFTGLQISIGVAWFSLVAAEMVSGEFGLGYVINTSYTMVQYPTIVIGMVTLGVVGYVTSAMVRILGDQLMQWRVRELALGGQK